MSAREVFVTGGTGYIGSRLIGELCERGHRVRALVRRGSEAKLPRRAGCEAAFGDALDRTTFTRHLRPGYTVVQLVGTPHPGPGKGAQFRAVDLVSARESIAAAREAGASHFVYVSVAHPSSLMREYIEVRTQGEAMLRESGLPATVLRPWYVLGPGHRWPYALLPVYALLKRLPATRDSARRLDLVTLRQMLDTLVFAVEHPADGTRVIDVAGIQRGGAT